MSYLQEFFYFENINLLITYTPINRGVKIFYLTLVLRQI
jgi:hypothetical protein